MSTTPIIDKQALRQAMRRTLTALPPSYKEGAAQAVASNLCTNLQPQSNSLIAIYIAQAHELSLLPAVFALTALHQDLRFCLPFMAAPDQPLQFAPWHPGQALILSARGFYQPTQLYPTCTPTIILTPLLAIDAHGNRMGQGLGMYDRTLQAMPQMQTIGVGFASQLVKSLPTEPHDIPLQAFVCESGLYPMLA